MTGDIAIGKILGIPFRLHWSWFLALFLISWTLAVGFFPQSLPDWSEQRGWYWVLGLTAALGLFLSVLLHELGHSVVAQQFGIPVRGIRLFVFGGIAELSSDPRKPSQEILIALGGPAVTLALMILFESGLGVLLSASSVQLDWEEATLRLRGDNNMAAGMAGLLLYLGLINFMLLVFNMIPAFPLDGGRVLRGILWAATSDYLKSTRMAAAIGVGFSYVLFIGGLLLALGGNLLGGVWFFFLGMFLQNAATSSVAYAQMQQLLQGVRVADLMRRQPVTIPADRSLRDVVEQFFLRYPYKAYPVVQDGKFLGLLTLRTLQETERDRWDVLRAEDLLVQREPGPVVHATEPVLHALRKLGESGLSRLPVVEDGTLVGLLCGRDIMDYLEVRAGLALVRSQGPWNDALVSASR